MHKLRLILEILNPGIGYTEGVAPIVSLAGFSTIGVGTFVYNEIVTGETSGTTARVRDFRTTTSPLPGVLPVTNLRVPLNTGKFSAGEIVVGSISSITDMLFRIMILKVMIIHTMLTKRLRQRQTIF